MSESPRKSHLSLRYRIWYQLRMAGLSLFGPAQLGEANDPQSRLRRERQAKEAALRAPRP